ncbi:MAG: hypothetical protein GF331_15325 [Chitinivibrionales bacterium]|nr:hypothetical protein [Chitinivibrionales bacterium]
MSKNYPGIAAVCLIFFTAHAQPDLSVLYFGASKSHNGGQIYDYQSGQMVPVTEEESAVYWMGHLAWAGGDSIAVDGQYGHDAALRELLPDVGGAWWGYPEMWDGQWEGSIEASGYNASIITEGSYYAGGGKTPEQTYPGILRVANFVRNVDSGGIPDLPFYLYMHWPEASSWGFDEYTDLQGEPSLMTQEEWIRFNEVCAGLSTARGYYKGWPAWWEDIQDMVNEEIVTGPPVRLFPAGQIVGRMFLELDFLSDVGPTDMLRDDAGHGTPSMYFLYGMLHYMALLRKKTPADFELPETIIPQIRTNYNAIAEFAWTELCAYHDASGRVWDSDVAVSSPGSAPGRARASQTRYCGIPG